MSRLSNASILGVFVLVAIVGLSTAQSIPGYDVHWFDATLDHFNFETSPLTFRMRYLMNSDFWTPGRAPYGGPLFYYTGNEGDITGFWNNTGFLFHLAPQFGALIVFGEHRYYGESVPFGAATAFTKGKVGFLSIEQALEDHAQLILHLKASTPGLENSPVIVFGGSYGGVLAAYMRTRYPNVVDGALAASAPVLDDVGEGGQPSFFDTVTNDFAQEDERCPDIVRAAYVQLDGLVAQGDAGLAQLTQIFKLCAPLTSARVEHLRLWTVNAFANMAMANYPYPASFLADLPAWPMRYACRLALNASSPLEGLAEIAALFYNGSKPLIGSTGSSVSEKLGLACFDIETEFIECSDQTGCGTGPDGQAWDFQCCTEFVYAPDTNNITDMFPPRHWSFQDLTDYCASTWDVVPRADHIKTEFDLANFKSASNIIFSNGLLDPWFSGGILHDLSDTVVALLIEDGAHHLDLRAPNPLDPPAVIQVRAKEMFYIQQFVINALKSRNVTLTESGLDNVQHLRLRAQKKHL